MRRTKKKHARARGHIRSWGSALLNYLRRWRKQTDITKDAAGRLKVYLFNVGQGEHILLELPNGEYGIIDFYFEGEFGWKEPPALTYLESVKRAEPKKTIVISFICLSHPDYDHMKGVDTFLSWVEREKIKVRHLWLFAGSNFDDLYAQYQKAVEQYADTDEERDNAFDFKNRLAGIKKFLKSKAGKGQEDYLQGIRLLSDKIGGDIEVNLIAPLTRHIRRFDQQARMDLFRLFIKGQKHTTAQTNLMSSVLLMKFKKHRLLFGGDTGLAVWLECLNEFRAEGHEKKLGAYRANFVKVSHHGSRHSSSPELWQEILKENANCYLGISAGKGYGHPHAQTLADISAAATLLGSTETILATNTCTACVATQHIPERRLDWVIYPPPDYPEQTRQTFNYFRPPAEVGKTPRPILAAYIFRFIAADDRVTLTKGLSPSVFNYTDCVYANGHLKPFPHCAVSSEIIST